MLYWSHYCEYPPWRHVKTLMTLQTLLTRHFRQCSCVAGICIWNDGGRTKCQNVVFYRALLPSCPRKKCSGTIQRTSVWQETITHFLLNIFIPSACTAWARWGGAGRGAGRISRIVFYDEWTSWAPPAPPSHFISIERLSTLQSHYLHYLHYIYRDIIYIIYLQISSPAWQGGGGHVTVLQFAQMKLQFSWSPSNWDASTVSRTPEITPAIQKYLLSTANDHLRKYMIVFKHTVCIFV